MRLRGGVQREVEQASALFGMPTRTELDGAHRKIVELERQMRKLRDGIEGANAPKRAAAGSARAPVKKEAASRPPAKKAAAARPAAARPAATQRPGKSATAGPPAAAKKQAAKTPTRKR
jgi:hypothetical protein